jgi:HEAT repeat protein
MDRARAMAPLARWEPDHLFDYQFSYGSQSDSSYSSCLSYISQRRYDEAVARCDRVIAAKGTRTDAALYWKAYAQWKLKQTDPALTTIAQLRKEHAQSRYLADAKVLEQDIRRVDPATVVDDDLKLLAIQSMQSVEPERAIPLLEGVLGATNSLPVKKRALYVLAQSTQPRAQQIILNIARGQGNPDLQLEAIRYLRTGKDRQATAAELQRIYESTTDLTVRRAIIDAYTSTWNTNALVHIASTSGAPMPLRQQAISGLTSVAAPAELWALYQKESDRDLKMQMVSAFGSMQALDQLTQIIKTEKEPAVRARAVRALGGMRPEKTGQMLADLYSADQDVETRKAVVSALSSQSNAEGLVAIARKEGNLELKRMIVERLSHLAPKSKVAADYLMEIIR